MEQLLPDQANLFKNIKVMSVTYNTKSVKFSTWAAGDNLSFILY
jgi:hypothetical protein